MLFIVLLNLVGLRFMNMVSKTCGVVVTFMKTDLCYENLCDVMNIFVFVEV